MVVFAAHWQWVSKWSIKSAQRLHFLGIRHTCLTSTIFPCPSKLCFSTQAQGATPPRFQGPFFPRESQEVVGGMNCRRHGCCVPWGCSWYSSSPLPTTHSKLPSSWSVVPVVDCGLSGGMIQTWTTWKLDSHILLVWEHCVCWSTVTRQHQDTPITLIHWLLGFLLYPLSILSIKAMFLPPAITPVSMVTLLYVLVPEHKSTLATARICSSLNPSPLSRVPSYRTSSPILRTPSGRCGDICGATFAFIFWFLNLCVLPVLFCFVLFK